MKPDYVFFTSNVKVEVYSDIKTLIIIEGRCDSKEQLLSEYRKQLLLTFASQVRQVSQYKEKAVCLDPNLYDLAHELLEEDDCDIYSLLHDEYHRFDNYRVLNVI